MYKYRGLGTEKLSAVFDQLKQQSAENKGSTHLTDLRIVSGLGSEVLPCTLAIVISGDIRQFIEAVFQTRIN